MPSFVIFYKQFSVKYHLFKAFTQMFTILIKLSKIQLKVVKTISNRVNAKYNTYINIHINIDKLYIHMYIYTCVYMI